MRAFSRKKPCSYGSARIRFDIKKPCESEFFQESSSRFRYPLHLIQGIRDRKAETVIKNSVGFCLSNRLC